MQAQASSNTEAPAKEHKPKDEQRREKQLEGKQKKQDEPEKKQDQLNRLLKQQRLQQSKLQQSKAAVQRKKEQELQRRIAEHEARKEEQRLEEELARQEAEHQRLEAREKRKALFNLSSPGNASPEQDDGRLTANGWESSQFETSNERRKFLRLMGGQKLVTAAQADSLIDDEDLPTGCRTIEFSGGEWIEASPEASPEEDSDEDSWELPADAPVVELLGGEWVDASSTPKEDAATTEGSSVSNELERQYLDGMERYQSCRRLGLGAS
eukprot:TRINITY_DN21698_c0_g1_i1.p1 TRINITY_DN21698_c0_g1~~TRINITY_DN21698_c0_g1_i1.p1  ORF type:complete len:268 (-),score=76.71 TRINITY_DN21698_c0_g1_i1:31-834(-)